MIAKLKSEIFHQKLKTKRIYTPLSTGDHPELDDTQLLDPKVTQQFQTLLGIANWLIQIETINIMKAITKLSKYQVIPRKGHHDRAKRILGYHKR